MLFKFLLWKLILLSVNVGCLKQINKKTPWIKGDIHDDEQMKEIVVFLEMNSRNKVDYSKQMRVNNHQITLKMCDVMYRLECSKY